MSFRWVPRWQLRTEVRRYNVDCKARVLRFVWRIRWRLRDGFAFVEAGVIVEGGEGAGVHAVNVEGAVEGIDFVLEDAGVPAGGLDEVGLGALVEVFDADGAGAGDHGGKAGEAEAAFVEIFYFVAGIGDYGIDDDVKRDGAAFTFGQIGRGIAFQEVFAIFDYGELQGLADLWRGQADPWRVMHRVAHIADEALDFFADDFLRREEPGVSAQTRFARLHNFQTHAVSLRSRGATTSDTGDAAA